MLEARSAVGGGSIRAFAFAPDGTWLVAAVGKRALLFTLTPKGQMQLRGEVPGLRKEPAAAAVSPDGKTLAVVDGGGALYLYQWVAATAAVVPLAAVPRAHDGKASAVAFTGDGAYVVTGGKDHRVRVWTPAGQHFADLAGMARHEGEILAVLPIGGQRQVLSVGKDRRIILWQLDTQQALRSLEIEKDVLAAAVGARGTTLALGLQWLTGNLSAFADPRSLAHEIDSDDRVRLIDAASGLQLRDLEGEHQDLAAVAVTPDGRFVAAAGSGATATIWDAVSGKRITQISCDRPVTALAFSPDGHWMLAGTEGGTLTLFRLRGVQPSLPPRPSPEILLALLEPSGVGEDADGGPGGAGARGQMPRVDSSSLRVRGRIRSSMSRTRCSERAGALSSSRCSSTARRSPP